MWNGRAKSSPDRHFISAYRPWNADEAEAAVEDVVAAALDNLNPETLWPARPSNIGVPDDHGSL